MPCSVLALELLLNRRKSSLKKRPTLAQIAAQAKTTTDVLRSALRGRLSLDQQLQRAKAKVGLKRTRQPTASKAWSKLPKPQQRAVSQRSARRITAPKRQKARLRRRAKKLANTLRPGSTEYLEASESRSLSYEASQKYW